MRSLPIALVGALMLLPAGVAAAATPVKPAGRVRAEPAPAGGERAPVGRRLFPLHVSNPAALRGAKRTAEARRAARATFRSEPRVGLFNGLNSPGLNAGDGLGATPPDTTGSIGPTAYVEAVNDAVAVYNRANLARQSGPVDLETFMAAPSGTLITDPQMQWDQQSQRWFYSALAFTQDQTTGVVTG